MGEVLSGGVASGPFMALAAASDEYLAEVAGGVFSGLADADLLAELRARESMARRQAVADQVLLAELDRRGLPARLSMPSAAMLLQAMLLLSPAEATRRVRDAAVFAARVTTTGEPLPALHPLVAAGLAAGTVSVEHARMIAKVLDRLPAAVAVEDVTDAEHALVQAAATLRPHQLGQLGERVLAWLDPDGTLASDTEQHRRRRLTLSARPDGTYTLTGELTAACGTQLQAVLSAHAAPAPARDGAPDDRSHGQRLHDALQHLAGSSSAATSSPPQARPSS